MVRWSTVFLLVIFSVGASAATQWQTIATGLAYTTIQVDPTDAGSRLHAFRIDLRRYRLNLALARDYRLKYASVRELGERTKALVAVNGGFFSPEYDPLGLRIQNGTARVPLKSTSWWGVFSVRQGTARIDPPRDFRATPQIQMAVQSGPRLVVGGAIPSLKGGVAERSALGITPQGEVVMVATHNAAMTTSAFAEILRRSLTNGGLGCRDAINLDGGRSSQLFARIGQFQVHIPNLSAITDAVIVTPR